MMIKRNLYLSVTFLTLLTLCSTLRAETVEVQAVNASKGTADIPAALAPYKAVLQGSGFNHFTNAGKQTVTTANGSGNATLAGLTVQLSIKQGKKTGVEVSVNEGGANIGKSLYPMAPGEEASMMVESKKGTNIIFIFTLKK